MQSPSINRSYPSPAQLSIFFTRNESIHFFFNIGFVTGFRRKRVEKGSEKFVVLEIHKCELRRSRSCKHPPQYFNQDSCFQRSFIYQFELEKLMGLKELKRWANTCVKFTFILNNIQ
ncbi:hypothetical protein POM88_029173 [Heracleum sosnowskyi]|uniref:Uncharacterized protein n=1 Tax=Heracleum sosnowskyi TaxID=360622 RepID=A0AAD8HTE0_9APIA|nr:hypothetical protein POM88_029173 [Heracleum sosnowskyi]